jgi:hypothetical protein
MAIPKKKGGGNLELRILLSATFIASYNFDFQLVSVRVSKYKTTSTCIEIHVPEYQIKLGHLLPNNLG